MPLLQAALSLPMPPADTDVPSQGQMYVLRVQIYVPQSDYFGIRDGDRAHHPGAAP